MMKTRLKFIFYTCIICIVFISCKIEYTGQYYQKAKGFPCGYSIILNPDSTFAYKHKCGWIDERSFGTWSMNKNKLILKNSVPKMDSIPLNVSEQYNADLQHKVIIFNKPLHEIKASDFKDSIPDKSPDSIWFIIINSEVCYPIKSDSIVIDKETRIDSFYIWADYDFSNSMSQPPQNTVISEVYYVKNTNNNIHNVSFTSFPIMKSLLSIFYYKPLDDTLKVRGKSLIWEKEKVKLKKLDTLPNGAW